eukprot:CCRYP_004226-RA/>CCRYP_004226-RA protein AED:0.01 eAED:0.01 QI:284/1/1/1/0.5/0.33/3/2017/924
MYGQQKERRGNSPADDAFSPNGFTDDFHRSSINMGGATPRQYGQAAHTHVCHVPNTRCYEYAFTPQGDNGYTMTNPRRMESPSMSSYHARHLPTIEHIQFYPPHNGHLETPTYGQLNHVEAKMLHRKRRAKSLLILAGVAFVAMIVLDGVIQLTFPVEIDRRVTAANDARDGLDGRGAQKTASEQDEGGSAEEQRGIVRQLVGSFFDDGQSAPEGRDSISKLLPQLTNGNVINNDMNVNNNMKINQKQQRGLHRFPLLPKHALQSRQRRDLYHAQKPLPLHLRQDYEDDMYHAPPHQRRRMYPLTVTQDGKDVIVDARTHRQRQSRHSRGRRAQQQQQDEDILAESTLYETGALYQGYGTHYLDLWVGTPPQRQTVIVDTGSSVTAFPCTGCESCGADPSTGTVYHLDPDYDKSASSTFQEGQCSTGVKGQENTLCEIGVCSRVDTLDVTSPQYCKLAVAYAEGSTWTAAESSDVVYPAGPHEFALQEGERMENGVGIGMGDVREGQAFDWMDFRLRFGCQTKVTGLFRTQLEDGIMGMDNRKGSFWLQLRDHYRNAGHIQDETDPFDPAQFSLCYDRQPLSSNLEKGIGSGSMTIGGSDPLLHGTPMVFADNITPAEGWYTVHIKGMFLRTKGGSLAEHGTNTDGGNYIRVDADEKILNGNTQETNGPIVDSGTTDTYLSALLKAPFNEAWKKALQNPGAQYNNDPVNMTLEQIQMLPTIMVVLRGHASNAGGDPALGMVGHPNHAPMLQSNPEDTTPNSVSPNDVIVAIPPEHYMEESSKEAGKFTARIYFTERFGDRSILGSNVLMGHEVLFDNNAGRVGFAESHCDYERYMVEKGALLQALIDAETSVDTPSVNENAGQGLVTSAEASNTANPNSGTPEGGDVTVPQDFDLGVDNVLSSSGWSRRTQDINGLRQDIRIPG